MELHLHLCNWLYSMSFQQVDKFEHDTSRCVGVEGKAVPLQACGGPEGSRKLKFPDYMTTAQDGGKVVSLNL
jgi:hypothetical protein